MSSEDIVAVASSPSPRRRGRGKSRKSLALIEAAYNVLAEIQPATVRAVCYRLFTMGIITNMSKAETNKVSTQLTWAREQGIIPWAWIVDETREAETVNAFANPDEYVQAVQHAYRRDRWQDQRHWIEVWSEKGTIRGTLAPVLQQFGVTFRVMHGYGSSTAVYQVAQATIDAGRRLTVLYLGDWDPSGLHMSEQDLPARLREYGGWVHMIRLALRKNDTTNTTLNLPFFEATTKQGDPRYRWFRDHYGSRCWELDALNPNLLRARVQEAIEDRIDWTRWEQHATAEAAETESLQNILSAWPGISRQAQKYPEGRT